jgi:hypothetical protein
MGKILIGIVFIIGGLSGTLVLRGTNSGEALAVVGVGMLIWGIVQMATGGDKNEDVEVKPIVDENMVKINQIIINKEALPPTEVKQKLNDFVGNMLGSIQKIDDYYKVARTMKEIQNKNFLSADEFQKHSKELEAIHNKIELDGLINKKAKPQIDALTLEKTNGTISDDEFNAKQETILKEIRFEVEEDIRTKPTLADIDNSIKEKLTGPKLHKVESYLKRMEKGNVITLYNNNHVGLFDKEAWKAILESTESSKYEIIFERI